MNELGAGFAEKMCENTLEHDLRKAGLAVFQHQAISAHYGDVVIGE